MTIPAPTYPIEPPCQASLEACEKELKEQLNGLMKAVAVVRQLRHPEEGCPWDLKQTHASLRKHMLEEAYEAVEAMQGEATTHLKEELGDVLLQVLLNAQIAEDSGEFTINDVAQTLAEKLIRRHPHVFTPKAHTQEITTPEAVSAQWQAIKAQERGQTHTTPSALEGVTRAQPALSRAGVLSKKAVKLGFAWPDDATLLACVRSEFDEVEAEMKQATRSHDRLEDELGDVLFACSSLAKELNIDPEVALTRASDKFETRFRHMERLIQQDNQQPSDLDFDTWEAYWAKAKAQLRAEGRTT